MGIFSDLTSPLKKVEQLRETAKAAPKGVKRAVAPIAKEAAKGHKRPVSLIDKGKKKGSDPFGELLNLPKPGTPEFEARTEATAEFATGFHKNMQRYVEPAVDISYGFGSFLNESIVKPVQTNLGISGRAISDAVIKPIGQSITGNIGKPVGEFIRDKGGFLTTSAGEPLGKVGRDVLDFAFSLVGEEQERQRKRQFDRYKAYDPLTASIAKATDPAYEKFARVQEIGGDRAVDTYEKYTRTTIELEDVLQRKLSDEQKQSLQNAYTVGGTVIDILERPMRNTVLPWYFYGIDSLAAWVRGDEFTEESVQDSKDASEIAAGGGLNVGENIMTGMPTESAFRAKKYKEIGDRKGVPEEDVRAAFENWNIFGIPTLTVLDVVTSYAASMGEVMLAPSLTSLGAKVVGKHKLIGKGLMGAGKTLNVASSTVYPMGVATFVSNTALQTGLLGPDGAKSLYELLKTRDDPNLEQNIAVFGGIGLLGSIFKVAGKVSAPMKKMSLADANKAADAAMAAIEKDPALVKLAVEDLKKKYPIQLDYFIRGEMGAEGVLSVKELNVLGQVIERMPTEFKSWFKDVQLDLFYSPKSESWVGGYAAANANKINLNWDTLKTAIADGKVEADKTLLHEMNHLIYRKMPSDVRADVNKIYESVPKGPEYIFKNPSEFFSEGVRMFYQTPDMLKRLVPKLSDLIEAKIAPEIAKGLTPPKIDTFNIPDKVELMPRIPDELKGLAEEAKKYGSAEEFVEGYSKLPENVMTKNEYIIKNGGEPFPSDVALTKKKADYTPAKWDLIVKEHQKTLEPIYKKNDQLSAEYESKLKSGELRKPNMEEDLKQSIVTGEPTNAAVIAAKEVAKKLGVDIKTEQQLTDLYNKATGEFMPRIPDSELADPKLRQMNTKQFKEALTKENIDYITKLQTALGLDEYKVRTQDDVRILAQELGMNPKQFFQDISGKRLLDKDVVALQDLIAKNADIVQKGVAELNAGTSLDPGKLRIEIDKADGELNQALTKLRIGNTETARALVANNILARKTTDPAVWLYRAERVAKGNLTPEDRLMITDLADKKDIMALSSFVAGLNKPTFSEKMITLWKAGLLTAPSTHIRNLGSTSIMVFLESLKDIPATMFDKYVASPITGKRATTLTNYSKLLEGAPEGFLKAQDILKYGFTAEDAAKTELYRQVNFENPTLDIYQKAIFRTLAAEDKVFKEMVINADLYKQSIVQAMNEGLKGKEMKARANEIFKSPTEEMGAAAAEAAGYATFNRDNWISEGVGKWKSWGSNLAQSGKPFAGAPSAFLETAMPFVRTPSNVALTTLDYTPFGIFRTIGGLVKGDQKQIVDSLGRMTVGGGLFGLGSYLASQGKMTGVYPSDSQEKKKFKNRGYWGGELTIDGYIMNLMSMSPLGNIMQSGAAAWNLSQDNKDIGEVLLATAGETMKGVTGQTFLMGLSSALKAATEPDTGLQKYFEGMASGMVPTIFRQVAESTDTVKRSKRSGVAEGIIDSFSMGVPGLRQQMLPTRDTFGQEIPTNAQSLLGPDAGFLEKALVRMFDPLNTRPVNTGKVLDEYERLQELDYEGFPPRVSPNLTVKIPLTIGGEKVELSAKVKMGKMGDPAYNVFAKFQGQTLLTLAEAMIESEEYQLLDDEGKEGALKDVYQYSRKVAMIYALPVFLEEDPDFGNEMNAQLKLHGIDVGDIPKPTSLEIGDILDKAAEGKRATKEEIEVIKKESQKVETPEDAGKLLGFYMQATLADPYTALHALFTDEKIEKLEGGAIILERMSTAKSEAVKALRGACETCRLDHTIPRGLGGDNSNKNLRVVTEEEHKSYTRVEQHLIRLLYAGEINEKEGQLLITEFKKGTLTAEKLLSLKPKT